MKNIQQTATNLPPKIPTNLADFDRAVCLLGNFIKVKDSLGEKQKEKLIDLIGALPTKRQAPIWKSSLKQQRSLLFEET